MKALTIGVVLLLTTALLWGQGTEYTPGQVFTVAATVPTTCQSGSVLILTGLTPNLAICSAKDTWVFLARNDRTASALPMGMLVFSTSGTCPAGTVEATDVVGRTLRTVSVASATAGTTGGVDTVTPVGTNSIPVFTGSALGTHAHELPWQIPSTTTIRQIASAAFGTGTSRAATAVSAAGTANTTSAAVALSQAVTAGTPAGTVSAPIFTGSALDNRSAFVNVIACRVS